MAPTLGILDLPAGAKITGSGFPVLRGIGAKLGRALAAFMLDLHTREHGYDEVAPPYLVNRATLTGTGQLPKFEDDLYGFPADDLFLIPTAEVPVTNSTATRSSRVTCCRSAMWPSRPASAARPVPHGKDTRGLIRVHQFDKVELVRFSRPEDSDAEHERDHRARRDGAAAAGAPLSGRRARGRRHRIRAARARSTSRCGPPASGPGSRLSSSSTFTDFQARRANIRFRPEPGAKPEFVHTLNASGVAFPRTIIALLENNQAADGSVRVPEALVPYLGVDRLASPVPRSGFRRSRRRWPCSWSPSSSGLSLGTGLLIIRHFKADATATSRLYSGVFGGLNDPRPRLRRRRRCCGWASRFGRWASRWSSPTGAGRVTAAANLPFEATLDDPQLLEYAAKLDRAEPADRGLGDRHGPLRAACRPSAT